MFDRLVALNPRKHGALRLRRSAGYGFASSVQKVALMESEIVEAAAYYPIVFVEDSDGDGFCPIALLGLQSGENLFVDPDGGWIGNRIPAAIRSYPFALAPAGGSDRFALCIDAGSELISLTEGAALFDDSGGPTPTLQRVREDLTALRQMGNPPFFKGSEK